MFNLGKSKNGIINIPEFKTDKKVGKPVEIAGRTIYPIIETYVTKGQEFAVIEIFPIALVIKELDNNYVISLTEDEINHNELIDMVLKMP